MSLPAAPAIRATSMQPGRERFDFGRVADATSYKLYREMAPLTGLTGAHLTSILTKLAHGLVAGDIVKLSALTYAVVPSVILPLSTVLYVIATNLTVNTFEVSLTPGGAALPFDQNITAGTIERWQLRASPADVRTYDTVTPDTVYTYRGIAHNADGDSPMGSDLAVAGESNWLATAAAFDATAALRINRTF